MLGSLGTTALSLLYIVFCIVLILLTFSFHSKTKGRFAFDEAAANAGPTVVTNSPMVALVANIHLFIAPVAALIGGLLPLGIAKLGVLDFGHTWDNATIAAVTIGAFTGFYIGVALFRVIIIVGLLLLAINLFVIDVEAEYKHFRTSVFAPNAPTPEAAKQIVVDSLERQGAINKSGSIFKLESIDLNYYYEDDPRYRGAVQVSYTLKGYFTKTPKEAYGILKKQVSKQHARQADRFLRRDVLGERVTYETKAEGLFKKGERIEVTGRIELEAVRNLQSKKHPIGWKISFKSGQRGYDVINTCWRCRWDRRLSDNVYGIYYPINILNNLSATDDESSLTKQLEQVRGYIKFAEYKGL